MFGTNKELRHRIAISGSNWRMISSTILNGRCRQWRSMDTAEDYDLKAPLSVVVEGHRQ